MEHLQVGLQLFLKLAKVEFVDSSLVDATERTGGSRFNKSLHFSTNMKVLVDAISAYSDSDRRSFVANWLLGKDDANVGSRVKEMLSTFTEECQFKIRTQSGEVFFQQDGIYERLRNPQDSVECIDLNEPVGPFRILKSYVKEGMHPYLLEGSDGFVVKSSPKAFTAYADMVQTTLSLIPKRTTIYQETKQAAEVSSVPLAIYPRQLIAYGAPGTGKSWKTDKWIRDNGIESFRTTFHPDSDYSTFVGAYKPTMRPEQRINCIDDKAKAVKDASGNPSMHDVISYEFRPQAFMLAYVEAWKRMGAAEDAHHADLVALVIEEINRGNCAQIFGDIFQLLDRDESGWSSYPINADTDLAKYLKVNLPDLSALACPDKMKPDDWNKVKVGEMLALPPNLYIHATMNTSDQSLFPIDSAFKRRWDWKYIPIAKPTEAGWVDRKIQVGGKTFDWWDFITIINEWIFEKTKSEDKQLGYFFVKAPDATGIITGEQFANKVLFYIYNDVFKDYDLPKDVFGKENDSGKYAFKDFFTATGDVNETVVAEFLSHLKKGDQKIAVTGDAATETPPSEETSAE